MFDEFLLNFLTRLRFDSYTRTWLSYKIICVLSSKHGCVVHIMLEIKMASSNITTKPVFDFRFSTYKSTFVRFSMYF